MEWNFVYSRIVVEKKQIPELHHHPSVTVNLHKFNCIYNSIVRGIFVCLLVYLVMKYGKTMAIYPSFPYCYCSTRMCTGCVFDKCTTVFHKVKNTTHVLQLNTPIDLCDTKFKIIMKR